MIFVFKYEIYVFIIVVNLTHIIRKSNVFSALELLYHHNIYN